MEGKAEFVEKVEIDGVTVIREQIVVGRAHCLKCQFIRRVMLALGGTVVIGVVLNYGPLFYELFKRLVAHLFW